MEARGKHVATSFIEQRPRSLRFVDPSGILKKNKERENFDCAYFNLLYVNSSHFGVLFQNFRRFREK